MRGNGGCQIKSKKSSARQVRASKTQATEGLAEAPAPLHFQRVPAFGQPLSRVASEGKRQRDWLADGARN